MEPSLLRRKRPYPVAFWDILKSHGGKIIDEKNRPDFNGPEDIKDATILRDLYQAEGMLPSMVNFLWDDIILTLISPFIFIAKVIRSFDLGRAYDLVRIMTGGGSANPSKRIWIYTLRLAITNNQFGIGTAMSFMAVQ